MPEHAFPIRVYYEDTDAGGIVYYANYLKFAERARTEMLRESGVDQSRLYEEQGLLFAVRRCAADYLQPARLDDRLIVSSQLLSARGARVDLEQRVHRPAADSDHRDHDLAILTVQLACLDRRGRAVRWPAAIVAVLEKWRMTRHAAEELRLGITNKGDAHGRRP